MSNSAAEAIIGAIVLTVAGVFLVFAAQSAGIQRDSATYPLTASFRSVEGISVGTDVRMAGIRIGSVTELDLDPETYRAMAVFSVRHDLEIPEDSDIKIASEGLLGGNFIEISPGASEFALDPGDGFLNTQGSVDLLNLLMRFGSGQ